MNINEKYGIIADDGSIGITLKALNRNGIETYLAENKSEARKKVLSLIPPTSEVMNMSSITLSELELESEIESSGRYVSIRRKLLEMDKANPDLTILRAASAPDWVVGSIHAITENGELLFASATGSQMPAYVYGATHIIWVAGAQKIVKNLDDGFERLYKYCLPLENERAKKAYGMESAINKILIIKREIAPKKSTLILVKEKLGY